MTSRSHCQGKFIPLHFVCSNVELHFLRALLAVGIVLAPSHRSKYSDVNLDEIS